MVRKMTGKGRRMGKGHAFYQNGRYKKVSFYYLEGWGGCSRKLGWPLIFMYIYSIGGKDFG